jgi:isopenicillin N synthase-like dioxygenase
LASPAQSKPESLRVLYWTINQKKDSANGAGAAYDGGDVILVAQDATYTIKHEDPVSAGQKREKAE